MRLYKFIKEHYLFLIILLLGAFLRFYRLPEMASFDFDQEYASNFAYSVLREFPIQMIGQGLSVQGLFMGPWYFYFLVPFYAMFGLHPLGGAVGSVILGLITMFAYYYFGDKLFGKPAGLIAAFFQAFLFRNLVDDWSITPAFSCGLAVIITWYCLYKYWQGETKVLPWLAFVFGLYTSFHPVLFPFYLVFLFTFLFKRHKPSVKIAALSIIAFLFPLLPLIFFEYFHKFLEVRRLGELFFSSPSAQLFSLEKLAKSLNITFGGLYYLLGFAKPGLLSLTYFFSGLILLFGVIFTLRKQSFWKNAFHLIFLCLTIFIFVVYYYFFPANVSEYYFAAPVTLLFLYFCALLGYFAQKPLFREITIIFLFLVFWMNFRLTRNRWANTSLVTLSHKDSIVKAIISRQPKDKEFFVSYISRPGWNFGFNYLFKVYKRIPKDKAVNNFIYTIVIPKELSPESIDFSSGNIGLILPKEAL